MKKIICLWVSLFFVCGNLMLEPTFAEPNEVEEFIKTLEIGSVFNYRNLSIVPIYAKTTKDKTDYITLDEAVRKGYITITELDGGRVPQVRLRNNSDYYILLVAGEILSGCRQDRLLGRDALIGPRAKEVILPVFCSEQGRWSSKSTYFTSESYQAEPGLRYQLYGGTSQHHVWDRINAYSKSLNVRSGTQALQDVYRDSNVQRKMEGYVRELEDFPRLEEDAVGVVVGLGDKIIGIDIFANPGVFNNLWSKLLKSYVALAISKEGQSGTLTQQQARDALNAIYRAKFSRQSGLDLGEELQAKTPGMICSSLVYRGGVTHLAAFPGDGEFSRGFSDRRDRISVIE